MLHYIKISKFAMEARSNRIIEILAMQSSSSGGSV